MSVRQPHQEFIHKVRLPVASDHNACCYPCVVKSGAFFVWDALSISARATASETKQNVWGAVFYCTFKARKNTLGLLVVPDVLLRPGEVLRYKRFHRSLLRVIDGLF